MPEKLTDLLIGKSIEEKADIKSDAIAVSLTKNETHDRTLTIKVNDVEKIEGGIAVFVQAWNGAEQIGFGDGTIDIERFRIFNPPILVPDPAGDILQEWTTHDGVAMSRRLRLDPNEAILQTLEHAISVVGKTGIDIIEGTIGNTVSTFYPAAGANSPMDAYYQEETSASFATARGVAACDYAATTDTSGALGFFRYVDVTPNVTRFSRVAILFNIAAVATDVISSAVFSVYCISADNTIPGQSVCLVSSAPAANNAASTSDFAVANWGTTEYATRIAGTSFSTSAYNDYTLNAGGLTFLRTAIDSVSGITKFGLRNSGDVDNVAPTHPGGAGEKNFEINCYLSDQTSGETGTSTDPKLVVTHAPAGSASSSPSPSASSSPSPSVSSSPSPSVSSSPSPSVSSSPSPSVSSSASSSPSPSPSPASIWTNETKHASSWSNGSKHTSTWTNQSKS